MSFVLHILASTISACWPKWVLPIRDMAFASLLEKGLDASPLADAGTPDRSKNKNGTMQTRHTREYDLHGSELVWKVAVGRLSKD